MAALNLFWQAALPSTCPREKLPGAAGGLTFQGATQSNPIRKSVKCSLTGFASQESSLTPWTRFWKLGSPCSIQSGMFGAKTALSPRLEGLSDRTPGRGHEAPESGATLGSSLQARCPQEASRGGQELLGSINGPSFATAGPRRRKGCST